MKKIKGALLSVFLSMFFIINSYAVDDLSGHWAEDSMRQLMEDEVLTGYSDGSVKPDNNITRAEFMAFANRLFGFTQTHEIDFRDIKPSDWYYSAVQSAVAAGYISGYSDDTIKAENNITRQEAAVAAANILGIGSNESSGFQGVAAWADSAVSACASNNIISGYPDGSFGADRLITRAEAFTMLLNAKTYNDNESGGSASYSVPDVIENFEQWKKAIDYSISRLDNQLELKIKDFDNDSYDLNKLGLTDVAVDAQGVLKGNMAEITYKFKYNENFKLLRAMNDSSLGVKLSDKETAVLNKLDSVCRNIIKDGMTDYEKELAIHDYIVLNFSYDADMTSENANDVSRFFEVGSGRCGAYAYCFELMSRLAGLDVGIVVGTRDGVGHAWNYICLDGEYYHVDLTADDPVPDSPERVLYGCFNVSDEEMSRINEWDMENTVKCSGKKYNYFAYNECIFDDLESLNSYLMQQLTEKKEKIYFYMTTDALQDTSSFDETVLGQYIVGFELTGEPSKSGEFLFVPKYE